MTPEVGEPPLFASSRSGLQRLPPIIVKPELLAAQFA
jgi:hypothetical protein